MPTVIALAGAFTGIVTGLYWKHTSRSGGYLAMRRIGGSIAFFLLHWPANYAGFGAFTLAALGMVLGSLLSPTHTRGTPEQAGVAG